MSGWLACKRDHAEESSLNLKGKELIPLMLLWISDGLPQTADNSVCLSWGICFTRNVGENISFLWNLPLICSCLDAPSQGKSSEMYNFLQTVWGGYHYQVNTWQDWGIIYRVWPVQTGVDNSSYVILMHRYYLSTSPFLSCSYMYTVSMALQVQYRSYFWICTSFLYTRKDPKFKCLQFMLQSGDVYSNRINQANNIIYRQMSI